MKKITLMLTLLVAGSATMQAYGKKDKQHKKVKTEKTIAKKTSNAKISAQESNFWNEKAEELARTYEEQNQKDFANTGGQFKQELEEIRALQGAIKELKTNKKSETANELAEEYMHRHENVTDKAQALKEVIKILEKIKKDWKYEFETANAGPEAAYL